MCVLTRECQSLFPWFHSQTTVLIKHDHSVEPLLTLEDTIFPITVEEIETTVLKKMEMFKCEYPRLESLLKDTKFPSTLESPVEESDSTVRSVLGVRNRFFRDYSPAAKIKAVEDLYGEAVEFAHQRDRRRYKPVSKILQQHSTAFPTLYLVYQYLFCQSASSAAVERSFSVQGCFMLGRRNGKCYW